VQGHEHVFDALPPELHETILTTYVHGAINRQTPDDELRPYLRPWLGEQGQAAFYRQIAQFDQRFTDELEQRYQEVLAPTLILWGDQDRWLPIAHGRRLATLIRGARFRPVPVSGHRVHEDAPEAIVAALLVSPD
jgi:pimeloyl-ACP methyl ester carboxylesterase